MKNTGTPPSIEKCDIRFRNGLVRRGVDPKLWRWKPWGWGVSDWDIVDWQEGKE